MCIVYANMAPTGLAGPCYVRLLVDQWLVVRPDGPLSVRLHNIQWQTHGHAYWIEMSEPTIQHLLVSLDRVQAGGWGYGMHVGETRQGTHLLNDDPEEPLRVAEIITITNSRDVCIWWAMNLAGEAMNLLLCRHHTLEQAGTPAAGVTDFGSRDNRGASPSPPANSDG